MIGHRVEPDAQSDMNGIESACMLLQDHNVGLGVPGSVVDLLSDLFDSHGMSSSDAMNQ